MVVVHVHVGVALNGGAVPVRADQVADIHAENPGPARAAHVVEHLARVGRCELGAEVGAACLIGELRGAACVNNGFGARVEARGPARRIADGENVDAFVEDSLDAFASARWDGFLRPGRGRRGRCHEYEIGVVCIDGFHDLVEVPLAVFAVTQHGVFAEWARVLGEVDDLPVLGLRFVEDCGDELA